MSKSVYRPTLQRTTAVQQGLALFFFKPSPEQRVREREPHRLVQEQKMWSQVSRLVTEEMLPGGWLKALLRKQLFVTIGTSIYCRITPGYFYIVNRMLVE